MINLETVFLIFSVCCCVLHVIAFIAMTFDFVEVGKFEKKIKKWRNRK